MELIVVFSTILLSNYFLVVAIGLGRDGEILFDVCRHGGGMRQIRGRMAMFIAVSSYLMMWGELLMRVLF